MSNVAVLHKNSAIHCMNCGGRLWALALDGSMVCPGCGTTASNIEWRMIYSGTTSIPAPRVPPPKVYPEPDGA